MNSIKTVAFIGAGNMGAPMARRVQQAGYELLICDRDERVLAQFAQSGASVTTQVADCAKADVVIV
ncbi:NAD(P)-binding domain-containing protein, partial [Streptomyces albidoflavus]